MCSLLEVGAQQGIGEERSLQKWQLQAAKRDSAPIHLPLPRLPSAAILLPHPWATTLRQRVTNPVSHGQARTCVGRLLKGNLAAGLQGHGAGQEADVVHLGRSGGW